MLGVNFVSSGPDEWRSYKDLSIRRVDKPPYFKSGAFSARCGPGRPSLYSEWLAAGPSGDRIPLEAKFSAPVQTGSGDHPASSTRVPGHSSGVKLPECGVKSTPTSTAEVKEIVEL